jgi:hypothetical protein
MSAQTLVKAHTVQPGDAIDFTGKEPYLHDHNVTTAENMYACVESVNGGWADGVAQPGEVVIYTNNFPLPIVLPADTDLTVDPTIDTSV